jgi:hypothetical protein
MSLKKHLLIAATAIILLTTGAVASAQTSTTTDTSGAVTTPGTPNTGAGGDAVTNWLILATTGIVVIGGVAYLMRRPQSDTR